MDTKKTSTPLSALEKAKQQHFDLLRKNNAITDAKNGELSLGAMKALDAILQVYQEKQETKMHLELSQLRKKLGLQNNNAYVERIKTYLLELKLPFELRDFNDSKSGKKVSWALTSFLQDVKSYKESQHLIEINISENFLDYLVEKAGYTSIDLSMSKKFKTKFGYKIYEMYLRYYSLPNKEANELGIIKKDIKDMNDKFGTTHQHASKMMEGIGRGLKEIQQVTGTEIFCFYEKVSKKFIFSWEKINGEIEHKSSVPTARIDELIDWIIEHSKQTVANKKKYASKLKEMFLKNELNDWESSYRGMLLYKYTFSSDEIDAMKMEDGRYKDFSLKVAQKRLFEE